MLQEIRRIVGGIKRRYLPSEIDRSVQKWKADNGDYKLRYNYDLNEQSFAIDLGGYQGQWASDLFSRFRCRIAVFEPVREFAKQIGERFKFNKNIEVFAFGLGATNRFEQMVLCGDRSSVFRKGDIAEEVKIVDAVEWILGRPEKTIDLIKINIEGGEYELIERLVMGNVITRIRNLQVQFHHLGSDSERRMERIYDLLRVTHRAVYQYKFVWDSWEIRTRPNASR